MHSYVHTCIHTYMPTYIHTYIHCVGVGISLIKAGQCQEAVDLLLEAIACNPTVKAWKSLSKSCTSVCAHVHIYSAHMHPHEEACSCHELGDHEYVDDVCLYMCICVHVYMCVSVHLPMLAHTFSYTYSLTYTDSHMHTDTHTHMLIFIHAQSLHTIRWVG